MNHKTVIGALVASVLLMTSAASLAQRPPRDPPGPQDRAQAERGQQADRDRDFDRDRLQDRDRLTDPSRDRDRDRTHVPDFARLSDRDVYGSELMSVQERNEYRMQLQNAASVEERQRIEAQHRETVQVRAKSQGVELAPPGRGIYGGAIMSVEERSRYREQLRMIDSDEERQQFMARHREEMQMRARQQGIDLEDLAEIEEGE